MAESIDEFRGDPLEGSGRGAVDEPAIVSLLAPPPGGFSVTTGPEAR